ncbi:ATP-dependent DNA helicase DinG [Virgibacillus sp. W0430]|uniref:ATP-dependent DNA helicase DinG n=1 Tax=Virgibacillus sp. W0430 TaxID=3391580 RepID=UPI003F467773
MQRFVVLDLETTGNAPTKNDRIIEVGIVAIEGNKIVDNYSVVLNPEKTIPLFISNLTGIKDEDVKHAPLFYEKADEIRAYIENSYVIAHNATFDVRFLNAELTRNGKKAINNPVIDTVELARIVLPSVKSYKLGQLATEFALTHKHPHRALSDAYVTAELFLKLVEKLNRLPIETIEHLLKMEKHFHSDLAIVLEQCHRQLLFSAPKKNEEFVVHRGIAFKLDEQWRELDAVELPSFGDFLDQLYEEDGTMQQVFAHYESRSGQREMTEYVFDAFTQNKHASIEAGTGIGKSIAYLIAAIYIALSEKRRIVISTQTTQLQSQLMENEIPLLAKLISYNFQVALLKGKHHYISLEKFAHDLTANEHSNYDIILTKAKILVWLTETITGDIDEIQLTSTGYTYFKKISSAGEDNKDIHCPWYNWSYARRARQKAETAQVIVTNHALLCTDLFSAYSQLPPYEKVIIDEAHHLEDTAAKHIGLKLSYVTMQHAINQLNQVITTVLVDYPKGIEVDLWDDAISNSKYELDALFRSIYLYVVEKRKSKSTFNDVGRLQYRLDKYDKSKKEWEQLIDKANRLILYLRNASRLIVKIKNQIENKTTVSNLNNVKETLNSYIVSMEHFFNKDRSTSNVDWIEVENHGAKNAVYLYRQPANVATAFHENLFAKKESVILTSATLTMKDSFDYFHTGLGLNGTEVRTKQIGSPFNYARQAQLLIPNDFPPIAQDNPDDYIYSTCEAILSLAEITKGRMLVLFTSYDMLKKAYFILKEAMSEFFAYDLLAQGITSGSRQRLIKNFQLYEQPILLGTSSFWEGVDIPGGQLACLVIVRLPFQPPNHPVYEIKANNLKQKNKNPFTELALPHAVIRFKQGFGRLIRSSRDRGIVFVCDSRVMTARYGKIFLQSIPEVPVSYDSTYELLNQATDWFKR